MKIVLCTTPIRPYPTSYPPFGSMAIIQSLRLEGYDPYFYDIDGLRPSFEEVARFFKEETPDVVCVSAVVSTAYDYTKRLAQVIKTATPRTKIVVGGNLAASSELLLRFCGVDVCVVGEGERVAANLIKYWETHKTEDDFVALRKIKGVCFLDESSDMVFTGYEVALPADEFLDPDWSILEQYSKIDNFLMDPLEKYEFAQDVRSYEPHRLGKKAATVVTAKGCVAKCTFCHRWDRGYRHWSVERIINNIKYLRDQYDVGFIVFGDENFGSDRRKLCELIEAIEPLDVLYSAGGVRVASVDLDLLKNMKASGCVSLYYGMETGSPSMLNIMEKNSTLQKNIDAARWTHEAGLYTIYQLVLAMPGEDPRTIRETSAFVNDVTEFLPDPPHKRLSINYIQALPGTPVYEYARDMALIGKTLEDEEQYLIGISDIDAVDDSKFLNFTGHDYVTVQSWRQEILFNAEANWYKHRSWKPAPKMPEAAELSGQLPDTEADEDYSRGGYFNVRHPLIRHPLFFRLMSLPLCRPLRALYPVAFILVKNFKNLSRKRAIAHAWEYAAYKIMPRKHVALNDAKSLRIVMKDRTLAPETTSEQSMQPLRDGR